jgi:hypothetical protein
MLVMVIRVPSVSTHDQGTAGLAIGAAIGGLAGVAAGYVPVFKGRAEQRRAELEQAEARQAAAHAMDRLPPGPADREEVALYLATLIRWLNTDPWPRDTGFAGPVLTPAAIERKLSIASDRGKGDPDLDADDLAKRCTRLVVLGGPGSGKTWLARCTTRLCAEAVLDALAAGAIPGEVELPLFTTCARLFAMPPSDGIRRAIVASALGQLPDLGGSRIADSLRVMFEASAALVCYS